MRGLRLVEPFSHGLLLLYICRVGFTLTIFDISIFQRYLIVCLPNELSQPVKCYSFWDYEKCFFDIYSDHFIGVEIAISTFHCFNVQ